MRYILAMPTPRPLFIIAVLFAAFHSALPTLAPAADTPANAITAAAAGKEVPPFKLQRLYVTAIACDHAGNLWIGTEDEGLYFVSADRSSRRQITPQQGLGDLSVYALAVDSSGRVWAGHRANGVSVLENGVWHNFDLSNGPLGHRVFAIACNPRNGDTWIATDCGLTRYVASTATWTYFTTLNGLPSNATYRLAIADDDSVIVGFQSEGIAIARPGDSYATWRHIDGPVRMPLTSSGEGLPSCQINDLATNKDELWVATPFGLAHATLPDLKFTFWRGEDWEEKARQLRGQPEIAFEDQTPAMLLEDYITRMQFLPDGTLALNYRRRGTQTFAPKQLLEGTLAPRDLPSSRTPRINALAVDTAGQLIIGSYGNGVDLTATKPGIQPVPSTPLPPIKPAAGLRPAQLDAMIRDLTNAKPEAAVATFLGDNWAVQGDLANRYGRQYICRVWDQPWQKYNMTLRSGPPENNVWTYGVEVPQTDRRYPFDMGSGRRRQAEWNDGSWQSDKYPPTSDGPDLWFNVTLPPGVHRVSIFFNNQDAHDGDNAFRDYFLEVKPFRDRIEDADALPPLCRARAVDFCMPVIKQFALSAGHYYIKINRQYSFVTKCSGAFIDRINGTPLNQETNSPPFMEVCKDFFPVPITSDPDDTTPSGRLRFAWNSAATSCVNNTSTSALLARRILIYRTACEQDLPNHLVSAMRWELPCLTDADRQQFDQAMVTAIDRYRDEFPMTGSGPLWGELGKQGNVWYGFKRNNGPRPQPADLTEDDLRGNPDQIKAALARHLASRAQDLFSSWSGERTEEDPAAVLRNFAGSDPANQHKRLGELAGLAEAHLLRNKPAKQRVGLAYSIAAINLAQDLKDPLAARALYQCLVLPNAAIAARTPNNPSLNTAALFALAQRIYPPDQLSAIKQSLSSALPVEK